MKRLKAIYFGDCAGDVQEEAQAIELRLKRAYNIDLKIEAVDIPPFDDFYHVLFFDWGGMSIGNSMLQHLCDEILEQAKENPSRIFIMTSDMTIWAMKDAISSFQEDIPQNVFVDMPLGAHAIKSLIYFLEQER